MSCPRLLSCSEPIKKTRGQTICPNPYPCWQVWVSGPPRPPVVQFKWACTGEEMEQGPGESGDKQGQGGVGEGEEMACHSGSLWMPPQDTGMRSR